MIMHGRDSWRAVCLLCVCGIPTRRSLSCLHGACNCKCGLKLVEPNMIEPGHAQTHVTIVQENQSRGNRLKNNELNVKRLILVSACRFRPTRRNQVFNVDFHPRSRAPGGAVNCGHPPNKECLVEKVAVPESSPEAQLLSLVIPADERDA